MALAHTGGNDLFELGLGQLLMMGRDLNDMSQVIAVMILIIVLGYLVDGLVFRTAERGCKSAGACRRRNGFLNRIQGKRPQV